MSGRTPAKAPQPTTPPQPGATPPAPPVPAASSQTPTPAAQPTPPQAPPAPAPAPPAEPKPERRYTVIGAAAVLRTEDGAERYLYRGATFGDDTFTKDSIKHGISIGLIEKAK